MICGSQFSPSATTVVLGIDLRSSGLSAIPLLDPAQRDTQLSQSPAVSHAATLGPLSRALQQYSCNNAINSLVH